jgi:integrase
VKEWKKQMYKRKDGLFERIKKINGQKVYVRGHSEKEVNNKIKHLEEEAVSGRTFKDIAEAWEEYHDKEIGLNTQDCYKKPLKDVHKEFDLFRINKITPMDVQKYIIEYARNNYARQTVKLRLTVLRQIFNYAVLNGDITTNPALVVTVPKGLKKETRELPQESDINIVKKSFDKEFGIFAYLLLYTGLRRGEALALRYEDIDVTNDVISVSKSVVWDGGSKVIVKQPKSAAGVRAVPLLNPLKEKIIIRKGYLFGGENPLTEKQYRIKWDKYKKETGINLTAHQLRHAYATMLFEAGIDAKDAQKILGHSKESVTRDIYTHIAAYRMANTTKALNEYTEKK